MRVSLKQVLGLVAFVAILCRVGIWVLQSPAPDLWDYGKLGVSDGTTASAAYYVEVCGIGSRPMVARVVRFADRSKAPANALEISHGLSSERASHTHNENRWNQQCTLIAGRTNDEKIVIPIDMAIAQKLFARPGTRFENYNLCEKLWTDYIAAHLPPDR